MNDRNTTDTAVDIIDKTAGNPEGKGHNAFLVDWHRSEPRDVVAKSQRQVLAEMFTSMLVLSSSFRFSPVAGAPYYLYWIDGKWSLSLIAPDEWSQARQAGFAGTCMLQSDMTWTMTPDARLNEENPVTDALGRFFDGFAHLLDTDLTLEELLPCYAGRIPYYPRLYASALSRSVRVSVGLGDQASIAGRQWHQLLPKQHNTLLAYDSAAVHSPN